MNRELSRTEEDVQLGMSELGRVLASTRFAHSHLLRKLLEYVCGKALAGDASSIKQYNIAVEALGRKPDFDPEVDSIVRVEFHNLRERLEQYYETDGRDSPVRIVFRARSYTPQFVVLARPSPVAVSPPMGKSEPEGKESSGVRPDLQTQQDEWSRRNTVLMNRKVTVAATSLALAVLVVLLVVFLISKAGPNRTATGGRAVPSPAEQKSQSSLLDPADLRIAAGSSVPTYIDSSGRPWLGDRYFTGGAPFDRPLRIILRTLDQRLYQRGREGVFRYDIPLKPGIYELHLHFAETGYGQNPLEGAEEERSFSVLANGKPILANFDIVRDAMGSNNADEKVFKDVSPSPDGLLHLEFENDYNLALVNGIEILPGTRGRMRPIRISCGAHPKSDSDNQLWTADRFFAGGRLEEDWATFQGTTDVNLYSTSRWGYFNYAVPVPEGMYTVNLKFVEIAFGSPNDVGRRVFDILCNGRALLTEFDILKQAGGQNRALGLTFHGLKPNAQGKLLFSFVPRRDYACLNAIEVLDESKW